MHAYVHGVKSEISLDTGFFTPLQDYGCVFLYCEVCSCWTYYVSNKCGAEHGQDWISCRIVAIFLDKDWNWIFIFEKNWIMTGSGYLYDYYNEISLRVI